MPTTPHLQKVHVSLLAVVRGTYPSAPPTFVGPSVVVERPPPLPPSVVHTRTGRGGRDFVGGQASFVESVAATQTGPAPIILKRQSLLIKHEKYTSVSIFDIIYKYSCIYTFLYFEVYKYIYRYVFVYIYLFLNIETHITPHRTRTE